MQAACCAVLTLMTVTSMARGARLFDHGVTDDPAVIAAVLASVPMTDPAMGYANLGERLDRLAITVTQIDAGRWSDDDLKADRTLRRTDVEYRFRTSEPGSVVRAICPIGSSFGLILRGVRWLPEDRTANWLMNGVAHCRAPAP